MKNLVAVKRGPITQVVQRGSWALFYREFILPGMPAAEAGPALIWMHQADQGTVTSRLVEIADNKKCRWRRETGFPEWRTPRVLSIDPLEDQFNLLGHPFPENFRHVQWTGGAFPKVNADVVSILHLTHYFPRLTARESAQLIFEKVFGGGAVYDKSVLQVPS